MTLVLNVMMTLEPTPAWWFFHGTLSCTLAEERLTSIEEDKCYLTRISPIKQGCLILSYRVKANEVKHLLIPEDIDSVENFISKIDNCKLPVVPTSKSGNMEAVKYEKIHGIEAARACFVCEKKLQEKGKALFNNHLRIHRVYKCIKCEKYIQQNSSGNHNKLCLYKDSYVKIQCQLCDVSSITNSDMEKHLQIHNKKPFKCKMCRRFYETDKELQKHQQNHFPQNSYSCKYCEKQFSHNKSLHRHIKNVHKEGSFGKKLGRTMHTCPKGECNGKTFKDKKRLNKHILRHNAPKKGRNIHMCEDCGKKFGRKSRFERHQAKYHAKAEYVFFL